jgi:two-component system NtrC family sensor kinase
VVATALKPRANWVWREKPLIANAKLGAYERRMKRVRLRLLVLALLPIAVLLPIFLGLTMQRWVDRFDALLISKVSSDLRIAEQYFKTIGDTQAQSVTAVGNSADFRDALYDSSQTMTALLAAEQKRLSLDFLLFDANSKSSRMPDALGEILFDDTSSPKDAGLAVISQDELARLEPDLRDRATMRIVPTSAARPIEKTVEDRGMILWSAYRVKGTDGVLFGGQLLNQNLAVIDAMNELIYHGEGSVQSRGGTTTLFLDDMRISTNVRMFEGHRALGTRVSQEVWDQVLERGMPWLDRAFVVNDWYISGYVPLTDFTGQRIGMLYTGFPEAPFSKQRNAIIYASLIAFFAVFAIAVPVFLRMARGMFDPLERMTATMERIEDGALGARIGELKSKDEIGAVARHLDRLLDLVQERDLELKKHAETLHDLVEQRTEQLREANQQLEATFAQLVLKEKLASLGQVTAGVAHEINNPTAVIQGNMELIRMSLPSDVADEVKIELDLIDKQARRIHLIVSKLLNFSKPDQISNFAAPVLLKDIVDSALILVTADMHKIAIERHDVDAPAVEIIESELQQVLINLFINAGQAMPNGGTLFVETGPHNQNGKNGVMISVRDTGSGIPAEIIQNIFDPFFTTKQAEGTGLGLSISHELIARAQGSLTVTSSEGEGTTFFVWCPLRHSVQSATDFSR